MDAITDRNASTVREGNWDPAKHPHAAARPTQAGGHRPPGATARGVPHRLLRIRIQNERSPTSRRGTRRSDITGYRLASFSIPTFARFSLMRQRSTPPARIPDRPILRTETLLLLGLRIPCIVLM